MEMNRNRVIANLTDKISKKVGHRVDLYLSDYNAITASSGHFLLSYNEKAPTTEEISEFFIRHFNAKITANLATARVHKNKNAVSVVAELLQVTKPIEDAEKMTSVIASYSYLDATLDELWEVKEKNGQKVLQRKIKDDISKIVSARRNLMMDTSTAGNLTFAHVAEASGLSRYLSIMEKGDTVRVYHDGQVQEGVVSAASDDTIKVKVGSKSISVARQAVLEIVSKSAKVDNAEKKQVEDYFADAYGSDKYAKSLTKGYDTRK